MANFGNLDHDVLMKGDRIQDLAISEPICLKISEEKGTTTVYSYKQNMDEQIIEVLGIPIPSRGLTENMVSCGLNDPDVFTPIDGISEAISRWALGWCD